MNPCPCCGEESENALMCNACIDAYYLQRFNGETDDLIKHADNLIKHADEVKEESHGREGSKRSGDADV